ncbi:MAG TPA: TIGR03086 family metal-binding protein [Pseudonocardia sp.]|jgi:uncharacterized protein (TIGR03086 family)|nr:TIGR03086 family metal-binding protein [Pseudonocardia sp.]
MPRNAVTLLAGADDRLLRLVDRLDPATLRSATPCAGWDARALLSHTLQTIEAFSAAADGGTGPDEAELFSGRDILGGDPAQVAKEITSRSHRAWDLVGDWEATVSTVLGPMPAAQALAILTFSTLIHSWDLARAIGEAVEFTEEEAALAEGVAAGLVPDTRPAGLFGAELTPPPAATPTQRVIAFTGRSPI